MAADVPQNTGFVTVLQDASGYLGGYLVTNPWGRPLEFRLSTAVQPNRVQQILYGPTLAGYICAELIGKTLIEKTGSPIQLLLTDHRDMLDLRRHVSCPLAWVAPLEQGFCALAAKVELEPAGETVYAHRDYPDDVSRLKELFQRMAVLDFSEPFSRIREAVGEARKMGVTNRG